MNDEEFYFEDASPKYVKFVCVIIVTILVVLVAIFIHARENLTFNIKKDIRVEIGSKISKDVSFYVANQVLDEDDYTLIFNDVSLDEDGNFDLIGDYNFRVKYKSITKTGIIHVVDTTAPKVILTDNLVGIGDEVEPNDFLAECIDFSMPCNVVIKDEKKISTSKEGTFDVDLIISDQFGNETKEKGKLVVEKGYNKEEEKRKDLNIVKFSEEFDDWDNVFFTKFKKALTIDELEENDEYVNLVEKATSEDNALYVYVPDEYKLNAVVDFNIIEAFNKYGYCTALALRVKLDNGMILYLSK